MVQTFNSADLPMPVGFDEENGVFRYDTEKVHCKQTKPVPLANIIPGLLNKSLVYPTYAYWVNHNMHWKTEVEAEYSLAHDVICIPSGLLGIEYNRSHIYITPEILGKGACIVEVYQGVLTVILQKNKPSDDIFSFEVKVEDAKLLRVKAGEQAIIPSGYFYTFINATERAVIFARVVNKQSALGYEFLKKVNGLAYYLIAKNAREEMVYNPRYYRNEVTPIKVKKINAKDLNKNMGYDYDDSHLYTRVCDRAEELLAVLI